MSGIEDDLNTSGRYQAVKPRVVAMDRATRMDEIRVLTATPDFVVGSVAAVTEAALRQHQRRAFGRARRRRGKALEVA